MALPNPLTFPIQWTSINSSGPDSSGMFRFTYKGNWTTAPAGQFATVTIEVQRPNADDYPTGQTLTLSLSIP